MQQDDSDLDAVVTDDDEVGDDLLRLIFTACHPVLSPEVRPGSSTSTTAPSTTRPLTTQAARAHGVGAKATSTRSPSAAVTRHPTE